jgi:N-acetylneuraminate lyase
MHPALTGLVVAAHTPFHADGSLNLDAIEPLAAHYRRQGLTTVFVCGSTGESHSLNPDERRAVTERWLAVVRGTDLRVVVHVGSNSVHDARALAAHAQAKGASAISALAPSYFKPQGVDGLVRTCAAIAGGAPELPFYYYDIPALTGVAIPPAAFLEAADGAIPNLAGIKFTSTDFMNYQLCLRAGGGRFDVPFGSDECLLAALVLGARGAIGSSYGFAASLYQELWRAFDAGDLAAARAAQFRSVRLIQALARPGYLGAAKALMGWLGVPVGPARLPVPNPGPEALATLRADLESLGILP